MRKRQKGELDSRRPQRCQVRVGEFGGCQRRAGADPTKNLGGFLARVLARSEATKFDQGMFGQALHQFLAGITACSKNRNFGLLHDVLRDRARKGIGQYSFWRARRKTKTQNSILSNSQFFPLVSSSRHVYFPPLQTHARRPEIAGSETANDRTRKSSAFVRPRSCDRHP